MPRPPGRSRLPLGKSVASPQRVGTAPDGLVPVAAAEGDPRPVSAPASGLPIAARTGELAGACPPDPLPSCGLGPAGPLSGTVGPVRCLRRERGAGCQSLAVDMDLRAWLAALGIGHGSGILPEGGGAWIARDRPCLFRGGLAASVMTNGAMRPTHTLGLPPPAVPPISTGARGELPALPAPRRQPLARFPPGSVGSYF